VTRSLTDGGFTFAGGLTVAPFPCSRFTGLRAAPTVLPTDDGDLFLTPTLGTSSEFMTPGLQDVPGRPRLFFHGGVAGAFGFDRDVAKQGVPSRPVFPEPERVNPSDPNSPTLPPELPAGTTLVETAPLTTESATPGSGATTSGEVQHPFLTAGLGIAFTVDAMERRLRIKPSIEYMREQMEVSGRLIRFFQADTGMLKNAAYTGSPAFNAVYLPVIDLESSKTRHFQGIGPGLEVEMDAARAGPVVLSLFVAGQAYRMLGDLDVELSDSQVLPADGTYVLTDQTVETDWDFHLHAWSYRGGVGLRFRWLPED
jgi:hypothetical protein